ncbi:MAG: RNA polymerase sigma factor [Rhizobiaceae bacterium]
MADTEDDILDLIPTLRRYARSLSRDRHDAEDLVQDSVEAALSHIGGWRGINLRGWLLTIMTNLHRGRRRRAASRPRLVELSQAGQIAQPAPDPLEMERLKAAIDILPPQQRIVLMLVVVEGYSYAEVAAMVGIPLGTVMSRLSRARHSVADSINGRNVVDMRNS